MHQDYPVIVKIIHQHVSGYEFKPKFTHTHWINYGLDAQGQIWRWTDVHVTDKRGYTSMHENLDYVKVNAISDVDKGRTDPDYVNSSVEPVQK